MVNTEEKDESLKDNLLDEDLIDEEVELENEIPKELDSDNLEEDIISDIEKITLERDEIKDQLIRSYAENENIRKRAQKEKKEAEIYGGTKLARDLLSVLDNLNRALESVDDEMIQKQNDFLEGIELTKKELLKTFSNHEICELAPLEGEKFDPKFHQAMFEGPHPDIEKGNIIQVMANGFTIGDRLLRAAQVGVSSGAIQNKEE